MIWKIDCFSNCIYHLKNDLVQYSEGDLKSNPLTISQVWTIQIQWGFEIRPILDFEWSKRGWIANALDLKSQIWNPEAQPWNQDERQLFCQHPSKSPDFRSPLYERVCYSDPTGFQNIQYSEDLNIWISLVTKGCKMSVRWFNGLVFENWTINILLLRWVCVLIPDPFCDF